MITHDGQLDVSPFPEVFRVQRCRHHALRGGTWIPAGTGGCASSPRDLARAEEQVSRLVMAREEVTAG